MAEDIDSVPSHHPFEVLFHSDELPTFGTVLGAFQDAYQMRARTRDPFSTMRDNALAGQLTQEGYSELSCSYSMLKQSKSLPKDIVHFVATFARVLHLNTGEMEFLFRSWQFDIGARKIEERFTVESVMVNSIPSPMDTREGFIQTFGRIRAGERLDEVANIEEREWLERIKQEVHSREDAKKLREGKLELKPHVVFRSQPQ